ncbi:MAG: hypothetical protein HY255_01700 [Betaproteobacteria bacterium]|nr:hypothetical protein [Betaproteobacteria bacterium]
MNATEIEQVAKLISQAQLHENLAYHLAFIAVIVVAAAAASYLGAFFRMRGETDARKRDQKFIVDELKLTTDALEKIRMKIGFADWQEKEVLQTKRKKLEDIVEANFDIEEWLKMHQTHYLFAGAEPGNDRVLAKLRMIQTLYFPELVAEVSVAILAAREMVAANLEGGQDRINKAQIAGGANWQNMLPDAGLVSASQGKFKNVLLATNALVAKASQIMASFLESRPE